MITVVPPTKQLTKQVLISKPRYLISSQELINVHILKLEKHNQMLVYFINVLIYILPHRGIKCILTYLSLGNKALSKMGIR